MMITCQYYVSLTVRDATKTAFMNRADKEWKTPEIWIKTINGNLSDAPNLKDLTESKNL